MITTTSVGEKFQKPIRRFGRYVALTPSHLHRKLKNGHYSIITAGANRSDPKEKDLPWDHPMFKERHEKLRQDLIHHGLDHTEGMGHYEGKEHSFVVYHGPGGRTPPDVSGTKSFMVHHEHPSEHATVRDLGKKYNQQSVIHSLGGKHELHFVTGDHAGTHHKGVGHEIKPHAEDYYTEIKHKEPRSTKFSLNLNWGTHHPEHEAVLKAMVPESGEEGDGEEEGSSHIHHVTADPPDQFPHEIEFNRWLHSHPIHESDHEWNSVKTMGGFKDLHIPSPEGEDDEQSSAESDRAGFQGGEPDQGSDGEPESAEPEDYSYLDSYQHGDRKPAEE